MNRQTIIPESEADWLQLRTQDLTSTDVAALFGLSPYKTLFELWHEKQAGEVVRIADNDRMRWGRRLEASVAAGIAEDQGWAIRPFNEYMRLPEHRVGSSFDFRILANPPIEIRAGGMNRGPLVLDHIQRGADTIPVVATEDAILEIKTVDLFAFRDGWTIEEGFIEAPAHIEIQVQHQMLVSGLPRAYIGVLVGGNRIEVIERQADPQVHAGILAKAREFWQSIADGRAPDPVMPDDAEAVIRMRQFAEPGKLYDARSDAATASAIADYARLKAQAAELEEQAKVRKAEILQAIGDAEKVLLDGYSVSAGLVGPSAGTLVTPEMVGTYIGGRAGYRLFRVQPKKAKAVAA